MSIKSILVPLSGLPGPSNEIALQSALLVAGRLDAHVEAFHATVDPRDAVAFVGEGMTSAMIESVMSMAERESVERRNRARELFETLTNRAGIPLRTSPPANGETAYSASFVERRGREDDLVATHGRLTDMIVCSRVDSAETTAVQLTLEAALRETGRPVFILRDQVPQSLGEKVIIAWNGSTESSLAMSLAMPILKGADKVTLLSVGSPGEDEGRVPGVEAAEYLAWHGVAAKVYEIPSGTGKSVAQALMAQAEECGADLLVSGAYTHSRLRRLFFGAVTGEVIENCRIPVLMAH